MGQARTRKNSKKAQPPQSSIYNNSNMVRRNNMSEIGGIDTNRLQSIIERIERLEEEKKCIAGDIRDIYAEAKSAGFDPKMIREVVKLRRKDASEREYEDLALETYRKALDI